MLLEILKKMFIDFNYTKFMDNRNFGNIFNFLVDIIEL